MVTASSTNAEKVALFRELFAGREDVVARRFENKKTGKGGYSPLCANQWGAGCGLKRGMKCAECASRRFVPVSDELVRAHLRGKDAAMKPFVMGLYPMREDETVSLAVIDFDKSSWRRDALLVLRQCRKLGLSPALERSRSGKGAHIWFFLSAPVPAKLVRDVLTYALTLVLEEHPEVGLDSYDRIIPNQNTLPKGGFGNLIALPLQAEPRRVDNSVFVDDDWVPHRDQWAYLSSIERISPQRLGELLLRARNENRLLVPSQSVNGERPWEFFLPLWSVDAPLVGRDVLNAPEADVRIVLANRVYVEQKNLTPELRGRLIAIASFANPTFREKQRMKFSVYGEPRVLSRALNGDEWLQLPRGCLDAIHRVLEEGRRRPVIEDKRYGGVPLDVSFRGELRPEQRLAADALAKHDIGILAAGTAFGKTVVAAWMIARRGVNTLVLVNRRQLQAQWVARLSEFLCVPMKSIGRIGGGSNNWTGRIDVALVQSLCRKGFVDPRVKEYGHIVIDECHAIAAESFEAVVDTAPARHVLGLSATVERKDGRHPLIMMQCGPVRHKVDARTLSEREPFAHIVRVRRTAFNLPPDKIAEDGKVAYSDLCEAIVADATRNRQIADDVCAAVREGRSPVVLTDRREHLDVLLSLLESRVANIIVLRGGMGRKERRAAQERLAALDDSEERIILATGSYLGEGFDDARLDTLCLAMPVSWKGRLTQYAGRLHRLHDGKREVRIYDYLDANVAVCCRMYERRQRGYVAIGYEIRDESTAEPDLFTPDLPPMPTAIAEVLCKHLNAKLGLANCFAANVRLPIPCGANPYIEVSLFSQSQRLAVIFDNEADVANPGHYRRTRHEDALLQQYACRILRFLLSDIRTNPTFAENEILSLCPQPARTL